MVAFVLGAGASLHAGYPLTAHLGNHLHDWARQNDAFMWRGYLEELFEQYGGLADLERILTELHERPAGSRAAASRIRQFERMCLKRWVKILQELRERYKTEPEETKPALEIQIGNADTQVLLFQRGNAPIASAVVYLYYRLGYDSVEIFEELGIKPPHVRQILARLNNAATGTRYICPKQRLAMRGGKLLQQTVKQDAQ